LGISSLKNKKVLVTGATGRLGCAMVERLEELGAKPIPIITKDYRSEPKRVKWKAQIEPILIYSSIDFKKIEIPDYAINFHWCINRNLNFTEQLLFEIQKNIHDLVFVWEWLLDNKIKTFVNISSTKIYSYLNQDPVNSKSIPSPITPYGIAKVTAENYFNSVFGQANIPVVHCRLSSIASYGENPNHLMTQLYNSAFNNKKIKVNIGQSNNLLFIDEAIDLVICSIVRSDKLSCIIGGDNVLNEKTAELFEEISGRKLNAEYVNLLPGKTEPVISPDSKILRDTWVRVTSLQSMIEKIITQYQSNQRNNINF
jgi:nucleoside-diphosphate-sugar epimerase